MWMYIRITFLCVLFVVWLLIKIILICNAMRASEFYSFQVDFFVFLLNTLKKEHTIRRHINYWSCARTISLTFLTSGAYSIQNSPLLLPVCVLGIVLIWHKNFKKQNQKQKIKGRHTKKFPWLCILLVRTKLECSLAVWVGCRFIKSDYKYFKFYQRVWELCGGSPVTTFHVLFVCLWIPHIFLSSFRALLFCVCLSWFTYQKDTLSAFPSTKNHITFHLSLINVLNYYGAVHLFLALTFCLTTFLCLFVT